MFKKFLAGLVLLLASTPLYAIGQLYPWASYGGQRVTTGLFQSSTTVMRTYPGARVRVCLSGTSCTSTTGTLATIYSDLNRSAKGNPFTAGTDASAPFFAEDGDYDVNFTCTSPACTTEVGRTWTVTGLRIASGIASVIATCPVSPTDATTCVQSALNTVLTTGGILTIPPGIYDLTTLDASHFAGSFDKQLIIQGSGRYVTMLNHTGTNVLLYAGGSNWVILQNFAIDSNAALSKVGILFARTTVFPNSNTLKVKNVGTKLGSIWDKAALACLACENLTIDDGYFTNDGGTGLSDSTASTLFFSELNTYSNITLPNSDVFQSSSCIANNVLNSTIANSNNGNAAIIAEAGAGLVVSTSTLIDQSLGSTTVRAVRIRGNSSPDNSFSPIVLIGNVVEMNAGPFIELESTGGANVIEGLTIVGNHITQSSLIFTYTNTGGGTVTLRGLFYEGNTELKNPTTLTLAGTITNSHVNMASTVSAILFTSGTQVFGSDFQAPTVTDNGLVDNGGNTYRNQTTYTFTNPTLTSVAFASLPASTNGTLLYCSNCNRSTTPCTTAGTGSLAVRENGAWNCY